jgi:pimeloyl-ACP methyl ester carboxylesterase
VPARRVDHVVAPDGLVLTVEHFGARGCEDAAPRTVMFAHGFGQTRHAWSDTAASIAGDGFHCIAADGRGHGDSGWLPGGAYALDQFVADVHALAASSTTRPVWVGASMGGLLGLLAQGEARERLFEALVLVDVTPSWETPGIERIMRFMRAHPDGFASIVEAQDAVATYLPHRASAKSPERLKKLLVAMPNGRLRWHWDPKLLDTVAQDSVRWRGRLMDAARKLALPVLLVSGGRSDLVSERTIGEFLELVPHAGHESIADATHMVVGDANDRFTATIRRYLQSLDSAAAGGASAPTAAHCRG